MFTRLKINFDSNLKIEFLKEIVYNDSIFIFFIVLCFLKLIKVIIIYPYSASLGILCLIVLWWYRIVLVWFLNTFLQMLVIILIWKLSCTVVLRVLLSLSQIIYTLSVNVLKMKQNFLQLDGGYFIL